MSSGEVSKEEVSSGEVSKEEVSRSKDYEEIRVGRVAGKGKSHKGVGGGGGTNHVVREHGI